MEKLVIIYDGDCPVCHNYVRFLRLKETAGEVVLLNARDGGEIVDQVRARGIDLDEGMVLLTGDNLYHGSECIHRLALMSSRSSLFNRINGFIFQSRFLSRWLYPVMKAGRNCLLKLLKRKKLAQSDF